jgi:hypothetical protein
MEKNKMTNWMPIFLWTLLFLFVFFIVLVGYQNRGNQNFLFATATVFAAIAFYSIHLSTSLRENKQVVRFPVELTIDRSNNFLGAQFYSLNQSGRARIEKELVQKLQQAKPALFTNQEDVVRHDFFIISVLEWLSTEEFDWQMESKVFETTQGKISSKGKTSRPTESKLLREKDLQSVLSNSGNVFADFFKMQTFDEIVLPKHSEFTISTNAISISNPVFDIKIEFQNQPILISNTDPRTGQMEILSAGRSHFSTYVYEVTITTCIKKYRSGDIDRPRLEIWFSRFSDSIQKWFRIDSVSDKEGLKKISIGSVVVQTTDD